MKQWSGVGNYITRAWDCAKYRTIFFSLQISLQIEMGMYIYEVLSIESNKYNMAIFSLPFAWIPPRSYPATCQWLQNWQANENYFLVAPRYAY